MKLKFLFLALLLTAGNFCQGALAATVGPVWQNDTAANSISFNDAFGHQVSIGTYNPLSGVWTAIGSAGSFTSITISGNATIGGTLGVAGAAALGGTLGVTGATTMGAVSIGGTLSGAGTSLYFASPPPIGSTAANTGSFTALSASGAVSGAGFSSYLASPPSIGSTAPGPGAFTTLSASGTVSGSGVNSLISAPPVGVGSVTPSAAFFTTLSASGLVSGAGFTSFLASPSPIGSTAPNTGAFTTLSATTLTPTTVTGVTSGGAGTIGNVGEIIASSVASPGISMTTATARDIASLNLTAGSWRCWGSEATTVGGTTVTQALFGSINSSANTLSTADSGDAFGGSGSVGAGAISGFGLSSTIINTAGTPALHLVMKPFFTTSTLNGYGQISCLRIR
jgi:hypothetical protein